MRDNMPRKIENIEAAPEVKPPTAPASGLPKLAEAGVILAKWVLVILAVYIVIAVSVLIWEEARNLSLMESGYSQLMAPNVSAETKDGVKEVMTQFDTQRKTFREFWLQFVQMILLNLLLPVLTAILGYVFGSKSSE
jgi:hypothetical protein